MTIEKQIYLIRKGKQNIQEKIAIMQIWGIITPSSTLVKRMVQGDQVPRYCWSKKSFQKKNLRPWYNKCSQDW